MKTHGRGGIAAQRATPRAATFAAACLGMTMWMAAAGAQAAAAPPPDAGDPDAAALALADRTPDNAASVRELRAFLELGAGASEAAAGGARRVDRRASLDLRIDHGLADHWRVLAADRIDYDMPAQPLGPHAIHTIKEAYLSWRPTDSTVLDAGRINVHEGVAMGYNPTDVFREGAVRSIVSIEPASLRENRQGSVVLRGQAIGEGGAATLVYSPGLADAAHAAGWNLDFGATNRRDRWLLSLGAKFSESWSPQVLLYQDGSSTPQAGLDFTALLGEATVLYMEWLGGRSPSLASRLLARTGARVPDDTAFRNRAAAGATWTSAGKLSLTLELDFDGAALDAQGWSRLALQGPNAYLVYRLGLLDLGEPPTRRAVFAMARWQDAILPHLDLSTMANLDTIDRSRRTWLEVRYRLDTSELALQWQRFEGTALSDFGASPQSSAWMALFRWYR